MTPPAPCLGLGLSGGGDSTALLLALREAAPDIALNAYIVDHRLRPESAHEAAATAQTAERAGARARILTWDAPRSGQGHARLARHRLLAEACREDGASVLCLAHTLDDRVETLRMRVARNGPDATLAGPGPLDASPVWPEGRGLSIARPFLELTRSQLRRYLAVRGARWIEDPSNEDRAYERVRLRAAPLSQSHTRALLARSEAARRAVVADRAAARARIETGARLTGWGGAILDPAAFAPEAPGAVRAFETLILAVSGAQAPPAPRLVQAGLAALAASAPWTGAGALLTAAGVLGRDPGAAGRADGSPAPVSILDAGETGVFDGRFEITGPARVEMLARRDLEGADLSNIPAPFRATLPFDTATGALLAGMDGQDGGPARLLQAERISARLVAQTAPAWFYDAFAEARACAALAKSDRRSNIGV